MPRFVRGAILTSSLLAVAFGCSQKMIGTGEQPVEISQALYNGVDAGGINSGTVAIFLDGWTRVCSGTLMTPQWILTAKDCATSAQGVWIDLDDGNQDFPNRVVTHPTLNLALINLHKPFSPSMAPRRLWNGPAQSLKGKTVVAYGAGNGTSLDPTPNGSDLGLRQGLFTVGDVTTDGYSLLGQGAAAAAPVLVAGDEGGGTVFNDKLTDGSAVSYVTGVHMLLPNGQLDDLSADHFHDWVLETINGDQTYIDTFARGDDGLIAPGSHVDQPWSPTCSGTYAWTASYQFDGKSQGMVSAGGATTAALTGVGTVSGHGTGAMNLHVDTDDNSEAVGFTSVTARCDAMTIVCTGGECVSTAPTVGSQTAHATWDPCNGGCYTWGTTMSGTAGDSITVNNVTATSSTPFAGATCGAVDVRTVQGPSVGPHEADVWAVCGGCAAGTTWLPVQSQLAIASNGMCFDDWAWSPNPGNGILQYSCEDITQGHFNQIWMPIPTTDGWSRVRNVWSDMCLEVNSNGVVVQDNCDLSNPQQFLFEPVPPPVGSLSSGAATFHVHPRQAPSSCLMVSGGSASPTAAIVLGGCTDPSSVLFFKQPGSGACRPSDPCNAANAIAATGGTSTGGCAANAVCTSALTSGAGNTCACPANYLIQPPGGDDVASGTYVYQSASQCYANRCLAGNTGCSADASCSPTGPGAVKCTCNAGYTDMSGGAGTDCLKNNCGTCPASSTCKRSGDVESCVCNAYYKNVNGSCVGACTGNTCGWNQICVAQPSGSYVCKTDPCASNPCTPPSECVANTNGTFKCVGASICDTHPEKCPNP